MINLSVLGRRRTQRLLLQVRATKLRAWTFLVLVKKSKILHDTDTEATSSMPMALTVLEMVQ